MILLLLLLKLFHQPYLQGKAHTLVLGSTWDSQNLTKNASSWPCICTPSQIIIAKTSSAKAATEEEYPLMFTLR
jgi:hypothetical protein